MFLQRLSIQNFRGLSASQIEFSPSLNVFYGDNGVGKTSLIEAIYFLSCCKSFRTNSIDNLTCYNQDWFFIDVVASKHQTGLQHSINVRRVKKQNRVTVDDTIIRKASILSQLLPTLVVCSERQRLFLASPQTRRNFLDWGLFHVKPNSINLFSKYERVLRQRNSAIKQGQSSDLIKTWDQELIGMGEQITQLRLWFIKELSKILNRRYSSSFGDNQFVINYDAGYGKYGNLSDAINGGFEQDCRYGYTRYGPHRSEFNVVYNDRNVKDDFSKGQIKLLVYFMVLSQAVLIEREKDIKPWLLFDDFSSDLSVDSVDMVFSSIIKSGCQVFLTSAMEFTRYVKNDPNVCLFHVEHGNIKKMI